MFEFIINVLFFAGWIWVGWMIANNKIRSKENEHTLKVIQHRILLLETHTAAAHGELHGKLQDVCRHEEWGFEEVGNPFGPRYHEKTCKACGLSEFVGHEEYESVIKQQELDAIEADREALEARQKAVMGQRDGVE